MFLAVNPVADSQAAIFWNVHAAACTGQHAGYARWSFGGVFAMPHREVTNQSDRDPNEDSDNK